MKMIAIKYIKLFSVEKDSHDTTQKAKESQDTSHKILELQKKLDSARSQVNFFSSDTYSI